MAKKKLVHLPQSSKKKRMPAKGEPGAPKKRKTSSLSPQTAVARITRAALKAKEDKKRSLTTGELQHEFHAAFRKEEKRSSPGKFPVVGIGASAGGIEASAELFAALPADTGMAFVLIQHLDPSRESYLSEILGRATKMRVHIAEHLMPLKPNNIYVIPPNSSLGIVNGVLRLLPRLEPKPQHMVINFFFRCLAEDQRGRAVGIVLSGGDGDGTLGLGEIKASGGITFVQDPSTAKVPSMPLHAERAGVVDYVLPVPLIARELVRVSKSPLMGGNPSNSDSSTEEEEEVLTNLFALLRARLRVDFSQYKRPTILRRIKRRMLLSKLTKMEEYLAVLQERPSELQGLYDDLLINVTSFFRDPEVFDAVQKRILPKILKQRPSEAPIRVWIPGCSCGEEAYSFAMLLQESFAALGVHRPVQIFATDISEQALQKARAGRYPESIKTDVSAERLRRFFTKVDGGFQISQAIRDLCVFAAHDVTQAPPFSRIDLISCRNLLIYLGPALQKRVMATFAYALNAKGYLVLGSSEATSFAPESFEVADKKHRIYLRKSLHGHPPGLTQSTYPGFAPVQALPVAASPVRALSPLEKAVHQLLLQRFQPAAVVVGEDLQIVQFYGDTSAYLEHSTGAANLNILKMARGNLQFELRKLFRQASKPNAPLTQKRLNIKIGNETVPLQIDLHAVEIPGVGRYRVLFFDHEGKLPLARPAPTPAKPSRPSKQDTVASLREELSNAADYLSLSMQELELANEELQSANEEILSSNEELQSTNEELETAKEELQSSNEELTTLNEELTSRNASLSQVNDDLQNLLASVSLAIVMVGSDLRIRRFTPMSEKLLNLIPSDVGRPITDFKPNFNVSELRDLISDTIDAMTVKELTMQSHSGQHYLLRIRPYRTADNKIDGAVLVFLDVHGNKSALKSPGVKTKGKKAKT